MAFNETTPAGNEKIRLTDEKILANFVAIGTALNLSGGVLRTFAQNTEAVFYQDTAPTGWTIDNTINDELLFVTKGSGAGGAAGGATLAGGTWTISGLTKDAHTHTGPSHTHTGPSHTHGIGSYAFPNHSHGEGADSGSLLAGATLYTTGTSTDTDGGAAITGTSAADGTGATGAGGTGATGAQSDSAVTHTPGWRPMSRCVIICVKD